MPIELARVVPILSRTSGGDIGPSRGALHALAMALACQPAIDGRAMAMHLRVLSEGLEDAKARLLLLEMSELMEKTVERVEQRSAASGEDME